MEVGELSKVIEEGDAVLYGQENGKWVIEEVIKASLLPCGEKTCAGCKDAYKTELAHCRRET